MAKINNHTSTIFAGVEMRSIALAVWQASVGWVWLALSLLWRRNALRCGTALRDGQMLVCGHLVLYYEAHSVSSCLNYTPVIEISREYSLHNRINLVWFPPPPPLVCLNFRLSQTSDQALIILNAVLRIIAQQLILSGWTNVREILCKIWFIFYWSL